MARVLTQGELRTFFSHLDRTSKQGGSDPARFVEKNRTHIQIPEGESWFLWRPIFSEHVEVTLHDLRVHYTLDDLVRYHAMLDAYEAALNEEIEKAKTPRGP